MYVVSDTVTHINCPAAGVVVTVVVLVGVVVLDEVLVLLSVLVPVLVMVDVGVDNAHPLSVPSMCEFRTAFRTCVVASHRDVLTTVST